ncbi:unnamed protein product, partial [marine sediment metagenome]
QILVNPVILSKNPLCSLWLKISQSKITKYAKQTQFAGSSNESKFCINKGL